MRIKKKEYKELLDRIHELERQRSNLVEERIRVKKALHDYRIAFPMITLRAIWDAIDTNVIYVEEITASAITVSALDIYEVKKCDI